MQILFICTANQCRSPIAEALLRSELPRHGTTTVTSAGLMSGGYPVPAEGISRMAELGLDLTAHRSRRVTPAMINSAGLILGMSRRHVRSIVAEDRRARTKCFTLKDFVHRGETLSADDRGELLELTRAFDSERSNRSLLGRAQHDDVSDPMGRSAAVWNAVVAEIEDYVSRLTAILDQVTAGSAA